MANRIILNNNENYNEPEFEPEYEPEYEPDYEEIETVEESEKITFRVKISNGYDNVEFDTTNFTLALEYMSVFKQHVQKLQDYVNIPQPPTQQSIQPVVKQGTASPKQRQILLRAGYTEAQINAMGQSEAANAVKEIFSGKN